MDTASLAEQWRIEDEAREVERARVKQNIETLKRALKARAGESLYTAAVRVGFPFFEFTVRRWRLEVGRGLVNMLLVCSAAEAVELAVSKLPPESKW